MARIGRHLLCGLAVALSLGVAPVGAAGKPPPPPDIVVEGYYGVALRYAGEFAGFRLAAAAAANDNIQISSANNDLWINSLTGIRDPLPPFCIRSSEDLVRCPLAGLTEVQANLGPGNDVFGIGITRDIDAAAIELFKAYGDLGRDQFSGGIVANEFHGGGGRDDILGGPSRDLLFGDGKNDKMFGLGGNDQFRCGKGNRDRFNDGAGKDVVEVGSCEIRLGGKF